MWLLLAAVVAVAIVGCWLLLLVDVLIDVAGG